MTRRHISFLLLFLLIDTAVGEVFAGPWVWKFGASGHSWGEYGTPEGLDLAEMPGSMQPLELRPEKNLTRILQWVASKPKDFEPRSVAHIWILDPIFQINPDTALVLVDGDPTTSTGKWFKNPKKSKVGKTFYFDLGRPYYLNRIVFYPRQQGEDAGGSPHKLDYMRGFTIQVNDGDIKNFTVRVSQARTYLSPVYRTVYRRSFNDQSVVDATFPLQPVRLIKLRCTKEHRFEIAEVEFYGLGFQLEAVYTSDPVDLQRPSNFGAVRWWDSKWHMGPDGQLSPVSDTRAWVEIQTRSGSDPTPLIYYKYAIDPDTKATILVEVSKEQYEKLLKKSPNKVAGVKLDGEHWSNWSSVYDSSGQQFEYGVPRRYFQVRLIFRSTSVWDMVRVDSLAVEYYHPTLADAVVGEVAVLSNPLPGDRIARVPAGRSIHFTYDVRAERPSGRGFHGIRLVTPAPPSFVDLAIGGHSIPSDGLEISRPSPNCLQVRFKSYPVVDNTPVRLILTTSLLQAGAEISGWVFNDVDLPQPIIGGDANLQVNTDKLLVLAEAESVKEPFGPVQFLPNPITPNGDRVNDEGKLHYAILKLVDRRRVKIGIYDLAGSLVRDLWTGWQRSGVYISPPWDGIDNGGKLVPPGIYMYRIEVEEDAGTAERSGLVTVVY
ncbi:MAG TPA: hypothetical protein EYP53_06650 [Candidatus Latescibacteria bacterium]|nr:hypothetical protein [Candidatus Latescibacterota bacterium]